MGEEPPSTGGTDEPGMHTLAATILPDLTATDHAPLRLLAGPEAMARIQRDGLDEEMFDIVAGASGGAKWLTLTRLDQALFGQWFRGRSRPLHMVGSSIGTWRFACLAQPDPVAACRRFEEAYLDYAVEPPVTAAELTDHCRDFLSVIFGADGIDQMLAHPFMRQSIIAARGRGPMRPGSNLGLGLGLAAAGLANGLHRPSLGWFFERTVIHDPRTPPPFGPQDTRPRGDFPTQYVPLSRGNAEAALLASAAVPFVFEGVTALEGARPGLYIDGGILDYHLDLPYRGDGLVLYPHFGPRIVPGWFDKPLRWRRARAANLSRTLLLCPSPSFLARLPYGKIPDRGDFKRLGTAARQRYWRQAVAESDRLADFWLDAVSRGRVPALLEPLVP